MSGTNTTTPGPRRIGTADLTGRLGVSRMTIDRWIKAGRFPRPHFIGEKRAWFVGEIEAWEAHEMARAANPENRSRPRNLPTPTAG